VYNIQTDTYTCPQGQTLKTTGSWHKKTGRSENSGYKFRKYRTPDCKECPVKDLCTSRKGGRELSEANHENQKNKY
jgi:radical SAM protein with 4Fe4S-binding SPASM domain